MWLEFNYKVCIILITESQELFPTFMVVKYM